ncbi:hypothetical protein [Rhodococcus tukisamuensis]|uniref:Uncharacterized protein n=1 Tax=Rhodococcus tukisamuensis TaxID=168276 RepID=A0A1G6Z7D7_9NOCA|nr:hypothetical protein [Rhodococcus tukisamuensis]SDD98589.1 hypothetical protein SAMN05444580_108138 [Rhodococcus tukisamuensis]
MTDNHSGHVFVEGREVTANLEAGANSLVAAFKSIDDTRVRIEAETGAAPEPSEWARMRNIQREYDRELRRTTKGRKGTRSRASAVAVAAAAERVRQRAHARTRKVLEHSESARGHAADAETLLASGGNIPALLAALARAREAHQAAVRVIEVNEEALVRQAGRGKS